MNTATQRLKSRFLTTIVWPVARAGRQPISQSAWVVCDQAIVSLASFLATVIVGRSCSQDEMGVFGLAVSVFWLAAGIPNALVWMPYTSRAAKLPPRRRSFLTGSVTVHVVLVAIAIAALILTAAWLRIPGVSDNDWFAPMSMAFAPFVVMMSFREHIRRVLLAALSTAELLRFDLPIAIFQLALLLWLAKSGHLSAPVALAAIASGCSLAVVWVARNRERFRFDWKRIQTHWVYNQQFGRWLLFVSLAWLLGDSSFRWIVGSISGMKLLGQFAAAQSIVLAVNPVLLTATHLTQAWSAKTYARGGVTELKSFAMKVTLAAILIAGSVFALLAVVGGTMVRVVYGATYSGLGGVVAALCLGMFAQCLLLPIDAAFAAQRKGRVMLAAAALRLAVAVSAGVILVHWRGLQGIGLAMALSCGAAAGLEWFVFLRSARQDNPDRLIERPLVPSTI